MTQEKTVPVFTANYPAAEPGKITLLSTPERMNALSDYTGKGVTIAFVDSGFYAHPDLGKRVITHIDATHERIIENTRFDKAEGYSWHGQMTSVIAAGNGHLSDGRYRGIASQARLILIKVMTAEYRLKEEDILRGLRWILGNLTRYKIDIVNLSVGGDFVNHDAEHPIHRAIKDLNAAGVVVVAAAGNQNANHILPPASAPEAITVGGLDDQNVLDRQHWRGYHSNWGVSHTGSQKPDIIAPAAWIASPILPNTEVDREARSLAPLLHYSGKRTMKDLVQRGLVEIVLRRYEHQHGHHLHDWLRSKLHGHKLVNAHYQHVDGTSVAAPIVSSIVAQMLQANPSLNPEDIRHILMQTAERVATISPERQGAGAINARDAVLTALQWKRNTR